MLRLYSEDDLARLRLIKNLVGELGLNMAGVQFAFGIFNRLHMIMVEIDKLEGRDLRLFLQSEVDDLLGQLQGNFR